MHIHTYFLIILSALQLTLKTYQITNNNKFNDSFTVAHNVQYSQYKTHTHTHKFTHTHSHIYIHMNTDISFVLFSMVAVK